MSSREEAKSKRTYLRFAFPLISSAAVIVIAMLHFPLGKSMDLHVMYHRLGAPLLRLLFYLGLGLLAGQIVESLGWTSRIAQVLRPLTRWGHLKDESGAAFITSFVSGIVSNSMLMEYLRNGRITKRELILTYLISNGLPVFLVHLPTAFFVTASIVGQAGLIYLALTFSAACLRSIAVLVYTRFSLPTPTPTWSALIDDPEDTGKGFWSKIRIKFQSRFLRLTMYTVPIYLLIFVANEAGVFVWLRESASALFSESLFPVHAAGVVIFAMAMEFNSGMAAAGALIDAGTLTVKQTALALILGTVISTPIRAVRHQMPTHAGIFGIGFGFRLLVLSQILRVVSLMAVTAIYLILF